MIIWLASYPKSGNTWIRSFLGSLLFSKNSEIDFKNLLNIPQYPQRFHFNNFVDDKDIDNLNKVSSYWIKTQQIINLDRKIKFLKTHHIYCNINGSNFTDYKNSLGVIYIVRDPRNVISSIKYHYSKENYLEAEKMMTDEYRALGKKIDRSSKNIDRDMITLIASWKTHYNSWKNFEKNKLLIKYEDLINNPYEEFYKIYKYLSKILKLNIDKKKIDHAINLNTFDNLKSIENREGFIESIDDKNTGLKKKFFHLGPKNKWENILDNQIRLSIEDKFKVEMKELGYL